MSGPLGSSAWMYSAYEPVARTVQYSGKFDRNAGNAYMSKSWTSSSTWTLSIWFKRVCFLTSAQGVFEGAVHLNSSGKIVAGGHTTSATYKDPWNWHHVVVNSAGVYVDGTRAGNASISALSSPDIGREGGNYFDGYISEVIFVDGATVSNEKFATEIDGVYTPLAYDGSYGAKGFHLDFSSSNLGDDKSGNNNDYSENNLATHDQVRDTPSHDMSIMNCVRSLSQSPREGGLKVIGASGNYHMRTDPTLFATSGKYYFEAWKTSGYNTANGTIWVGVISEDATNQAYNNNAVWHQQDSSGVAYRNNGTITVNNSNTNSGLPNFWSGTLQMLALDMDNNKLWVGYNGTWTGNPAGNSGQAYSGSILSSNDMGFSVGTYSGSDYYMNYGQDSSFSGVRTRQNNQDGDSVGDFYYTPPSGFKAMISSHSGVSKYTP